MAEFVLNRHKDISGVSGLGVVAHGVEYPDGSVALRWPGEHPSTAVWPDIRDVEAVHGHEGTTLVQYLDDARLLAAYKRVVPWLLEAAHSHPKTVAPHPDHPDRLRLTFPHERAWAFWVALFDGSTYAATHEEVNGEIEHRWITPDGGIWLLYYTRPQPNPILTWESHDDPEVNR